jgi:hypothetical protein
MQLRTFGNNQTAIAFADGSEIFFSYQTPVAGFSPGLGYFQTAAKFSRTTSRHVSTYLRDHGPRVSDKPIATLPQAQIEKMAEGFAAL